MEDIKELKDIQEHEWRWTHFSRDEMKCKGSGECRVDPTFMDKLEAVRGEYGSPMPVSSGYRSPEYNNHVSTTGFTGPHTMGCAVDIPVRGHNAYRLMYIALKHGMTGIGVSQKGKSRFLHMDSVVSENRPAVWSY